MSPAVVASASSTISDPIASKSTGTASSSAPRPRTKRVVKRRGRAARGDGSDDEIEREARSDDSASDSDLLDDSDSDDDDSAEEGVAPSESSARVKGVGAGANGHEKNGIAHANGHADASSLRPGTASDGEEGVNGKMPDPPRSAPAFLSSGADWSEMVAEEGAGTVPVIDFGELGDHVDPGTEEDQASRSDDGLISAANRDDNGDGGATGAAEGSSSTQRPPRGGTPVRGSTRLPNGQSARQAYQERLQADPAFVPVVGEFWGHDDRLMKKEFRSLSGWWRGRWQGRGRGGFVGRGGWRGRGVSVGGPPPMNGVRPVEGKDDEVQGRSPVPDVPPIEKEWGHDGFEEMKAKEERIKATRQQQDLQRGGKVGRGAATRGAFVPRGRGSASIPRGAALSPSTTRRMPFKADPERPWFTEKPENIWTKQHESYLPTLRQKQVNTPTIRLRLPGKDSKVTKLPAKASEPRSVTVDASSAPASQSPSVASTSASKVITIHLPKSKSASEDLSDSVPSTEPSESLVSADDTLQGTSPTELPVNPADTQDSSFTSSLNGVTATPSLTRANSISDRSATDGHVAPDVSVPPLAIPPVTYKPEVPIAAPIVPIVTGGYIPPIQPTPQYAGSPYPYSAPLPPGIAVNQQGYPYDVASGRPVYMHPTPPPMPMFNPRPMPYGHMHHHSQSMSGDFMQAPSPPLNGFVDPSTGQPLFAPPRQSARLEIRAPTEGSDVRPAKERRPSNLRSSTTTASVVTNDSEQTASPQHAPHTPSHPQSQLHVSAPSGLARFASAPEYYPADANSMRAYPSMSENGLAASPNVEDGHGMMMGQPTMDPGMMAYNPYQQQQYYYPEQYYGGYMEMPQGSGQYDPYADPRNQQPVYYH